MLNIKCDEILANRCVHHLGAVGSGVTVSLECAGEKKGRFVFIMLQGTESLTLCEVEVFSKTVKEIGTCSFHSI